jgi:hypothetical protein
MRLDITPPFFMLDGYPPRIGNIVGYINNSYELEPPIEHNVEYVECIKKPRHPCMHPKIQSYVMVHATHTIHARDEILARYYPWRNRSV